MSSNLARMCFASRPSMMAIELRNTESCGSHMRSTSLKKEDRAVGVGPTPMGAMMIWSTATLLESATKLVAFSLRMGRGNLYSRYLFQRPMTGPDNTLSRECLENVQEVLTYARSKDKKAESASNVVVGSLFIVIFGRNLDRWFEMLSYVCGSGIRTSCCDSWATTSPKAVKAPPAIARVRWGYASKDLR